MVKGSGNEWEWDRDRNLILKGFMINNNHKPAFTSTGHVWRAVVSTLHILNADSLWRRESQVEWDQRKSQSSEFKLGRLPMHDLVTSWPWSFGEYWFTELGRSLNCWHILLFSTLQITFVNSATCLHQVSLHWEALKFHGGGSKFPEILIFPWKLRCSVWQWTLLLFSWM